MSDQTSLSPRQLGVAISAVVAGGAVGTIVRDLCLKLSTRVAASAPWDQLIPWVLLAINTVGVFGATLALRGPLRHRDPNDIGRLVVITGFFGGFTSYSSLYVALGAIWHVSVSGAVVTAVGAILAGVVAAAAALLVSK
jgi:CrcB protein